MLLPLLLNLQQSEAIASKALAVAGIVGATVSAGTSGGLATTGSVTVTVTTK